MKTTLNIDDTVMQRLREESARRGTTMSALVEAALRTILDEKPAKPTELLPLPSWNMGKPLVDISNREELYRVLYEEHDRKLYWDDANARQDK
ncbi:MAG: hypothetical protein OXE50_10895 [Chloroflexi bacterium]|nr:hypothetical protein [Chloroflexota bacterium]